ncbi:hypothetical protein JW707_02455 [Candidatus Woesearchaeota archaeon]|nr:hypothetical protein [Candidatus Woesearchaeota archaeon]
MLRSTLKDKKEFTNAPEACRGCFRWSQWQNKCSFFWKNKKECGSKVRDHEEMVNLDQLRRH